MVFLIMKGNFRIAKNDEPEQTQNNQANDQDNDQETPDELQEQMKIKSHIL